MSSTAGYPRLDQKSKYERGVVKKKSKYSKDKKLNANLKDMDRQYKEAVRSAQRTDILLQEEAGFLEAEGMEKTYKFKQSEIKENVDVSTANKNFDLKLKEYGPYSIDYSRNGRELLIGGKKGHVASMDWRTGALSFELHLNETVNAVKFLHNDQYLAVAQKKYTFIYDKTGTELHRLKQHIEATNLEFLPYHFLLATSGNTGYLKYHDVSTGVLVAEHRTKLGPTLAMRQNPWNGVMHLGHGNGTVTLWSPSMPTPLVKIQACRGPVRSLAINRDGRYMAVAGADKTLKIWDIRNFKEVDSYFTPTPASSLDISDTGLLSVGWGPHVTVWKDTFKSKQNSPYMTHLVGGSRIQQTRFVPFEDALGVGHQGGVQSLIIPGAGEANYDALEINPFETAKQRQQSEVRSLMNKLSPDMISLDPNVIGSVDKRLPSVRLTAKDVLELANVDSDTKEKQELELKIRPQVKGKNSALRRHLRKKTENVIDQRKLRLEKNLSEEKKLRQQLKNAREGVPEEKDLLGPALARFK